MFINFINAQRWMICVKMRSDNRCSQCCGSGNNLSVIWFNENYSKTAHRKEKNDLSKILTILPELWSLSVWVTVLRIGDVYPGSQILIFTHPGSRISDPGSKNSNKREGWKNCCHTFFCSHKFHKIENQFIFEMVKKKIWANFQRIKELFTQKIVTSSHKYGFGIRDPRFGIREKPIPDPGFRDQKGTGSRIRNTGLSRFLSNQDLFFCRK